MGIAVHRIWLSTPLREFLRPGFVDRKACSEKALSNKGIPNGDSMTEAHPAPGKLVFLWLFFSLAFFVVFPAFAHAAAARPIVSVSSPGAGSSYAMPFRIAEEQNFYVDEGLDVRIVSGVRTATSVQMLVGGTVDAPKPSARPHSPLFSAGCRSRSSWYSTTSRPTGCIRKRLSGASPN